MRREVLDCKVILAHGLTHEQAFALQDAIRNRVELNPLFKDRVIFVASNSKREQDATWYVYVVDETLQKAFMDKPDNFLFELSGPGKLPVNSASPQKFEGDVLSRNMKNYD